MRPRTRLTACLAIDVWAAGVILLSIMCQKFPVFVSGDDMEALLEIGCIFGQGQLEKAAHLHSKPSDWKGDDSAEAYAYVQVALFRHPFLVSAILPVACSNWYAS